MKSFLYERATSVPQLKDSIFFQTPKINFLRHYETRVYYNGGGERHRHRVKGTGTGK